MSTYVSVKQMARRHGVSESTVRRRVESGEWPAGRDGKLIRFSPEDQVAIAQRIAVGRDTAEVDDLMDRALALLAA